MFLFAMSAFAADPAPPATAAPATTAPAAAAVPTFESLDVNKDQGVDKTEAAKDAKLNAEFVTLDTDKNGKLSTAEFKVWADKMAAPAK